MLVAILIVVAAIAVAFALPLGAFVRLGIVVAGFGLGIATTQSGRDVLTIVGAVAGVVPNPNAGLSGAAPPTDTTDRASVTYRVTATVRVNGELRSGSSLQTVSIQRNITFGSNQISNVTIRFAGEAVVVPILDGSNLLVLMQGHGSSYENVMASPCRDMRINATIERTPADDYLANAATFAGPCSLVPERLPLMIAALNVGSDTEFQEVVPSAFSDVFRGDVEFVSLIYTRHEGPIVRHLEVDFPWIRLFLDPDRQITVDIAGLIHTIYPEVIVKGTAENW